MSHELEKESRQGILIGIRDPYHLLSLPFSKDMASSFVFSHSNKAMEKFHPCIPTGEIVRILQGWWRLSSENRYFPIIG